MRITTALKYALKYHAMAFVPTLIGALIVAAAVWFGVGRFVLDAVQTAGGSPTAMASAVVSAVLGSASPLLVVAGIAVGYLVRRVGKTALLVRANAQAVEAARANAADEVSPAPQEATEAPDPSAVETPPATESVGSGDSTNSSDATATGSANGDRVESAAEEQESDADAAAPGSAATGEGATAAGDATGDEGAAADEATSGGFDDTWARADESIEEDANDGRDRADGDDRTERQ